MAVKPASKRRPARSAPLRPLWGSPGGKKLLAPRIVALIPAHRTYVEPFAGGAAVFWAKPPAGREVLADRDPEIAAAYRFVRERRLDVRPRARAAGLERARRLRVRPA